MSRTALFRIPILRNFVPRISIISRPVLPLTSEIPSTSLRAPTRLRWSPQTRLFQQSATRLFSSSPESPHSQTSHGPGPGASLSQRLKYLIRSYGWYALGVYTILSALDFTVAFAAINVLGAEQVSRVTTTIKEYFMSILHTTPLEPGKEEVEEASHGRRETLYAALVLAYTVHKTLFLPIRVGLTAGITPKLVGWLRQRGWAGGAGTKRAALEMRDRMRRTRDRD